jgi:hypothetical protein
LPPGKRVCVCVQPIGEVRGERKAPREPPDARQFPHEAVPHAIIVYIEEKLYAACRFRVILARNVRDEEPVFKVRARHHPRRDGQREAERSRGAVSLHASFGPRAATVGLHAAPVGLHAAPVGRHAAS